MKAIFITTLILISSNLFAIDICKTQQKLCDHFISFDLDRNQLIECEEIDNMYEIEFKDSLLKALDSTPFMKRFHKSIFRYYVRYGKIPQFADFDSAAQFTKFLLKSKRCPRFQHQRSRSQYSQMDILGFAIALREIQ